MKTSHILALGFLSLFAVYGCSQSSQDEEEDPADQGETEDKLILGHGNVDNAAIVESTTIMLVTDLAGIGPVAPPIDPALDRYNQADPFNIEAARFKNSFGENLVKFDNMDGQIDWKPEQSSVWLSRMASSNYVVVDTSKPCRFDEPHTYLEIERAALTGTEHATCGGRRPNEDALDVTLNFLVRGPAASAQDDGAIHDGVDSATQRATPTFPYLAELNGL